MTKASTQNKLESVEESYQSEYEDEERPKKIAGRPLEPKETNSDKIREIVSNWLVNTLKKAMTRCKRADTATTS